MNPHIYKFKLVKVISSDTIVVNIDLGMNIWTRNVKIKLNKVNGYAIEEGSSLERQIKHTGLTSEIIKEKGLNATRILREELEGYHRDLLIHTLKKDSRGRWLSDIYLEGVEQSLNDWMLEEQLVMGFNYVKEES